MPALATFTSATAEGGARLVSVAGELDLSNVAELGGVLEAGPGDAARALVVDLSAVTYLDSSAVETLIVAARRGARMRLVTPPASTVRRSLEVLGIAHVMPLHDRLADAVAAG